MRAKLFLFLIFSSLTSLSYSQKLTQEDFQGLWYRINEYGKNFDSLYNLQYQKIISANSYRDTIEKIDIPKKSLDSVNRVPNNLLDEISVLTGGFRAQYSCQEPLDVFEINNNSAKFYTNVFYSDVFYSDEERYELQETYGYRFLFANEGEIFETNYTIKDDTLFLKRKEFNSIAQNEILYCKNDTLVLRNSRQNYYNVFVKKKIEKNIRYKILEIISYRSVCLGTCPEYTTDINANGRINYVYTNSPMESKKLAEIKDGEYFGKINKKDMNELFYILSFFDVTKSEKSFCIGMTDTDFRSITFTLDNGKVIKIRDFHYSGPPFLRVVDEMIYNFMKKVASKK